MSKTVNPFPGRDVDPVLLVLDNTRVTLEKCVDLAREPNAVRRAHLLYNYITTKAVSDLFMVGDGMQSADLTKSLKEVRKLNPLDEMGYWLWVGQHYADKVAEL
jgi:hypothetical protein